jgi:hypothetical protein
MKPMTTNATTQVKADALTDEFPLAEYAISAKTIKRARWENLQVAACQGTNHLNVCNYSHGVEEKADHTHTVTIENGMPVECTCAAFTYNQGLCKHCLAVAADPEAMDTAEAETEEQTDANEPTTETAVTDGGTTVESVGRKETNARPKTDHWGNALQQFTDKPVGAGERCECQTCGERFEIAMVAATADTSLSNWEEFYECQTCGAQGSFRFEGETHTRRWTGRMDYPEQMI